MVPNMKAKSRMAKSAAKEESFLSMATTILANFRMIYKMVMVFSRTYMVLLMKENGLMECTMAKEKKP